MLDKIYNPKNSEERLYHKEEPHFKSKHNDVVSYCVMMPPPNVTGNLHLGHALTYTLQDILVRFKRCQGFDVLWQPGTDHAGIATQMVVERNLAKDGIKRQDLGRSYFLKKVWEWKQQSGDAITNQQRRLCISADWQRTRFTMDEGLSQSVKKVFIDLYNQGLIYRDKRLSNWDIKFQTALSDLEVENKEENGHLWHITYPFSDNPTQFITVATTRPETMFGDQAIAVNPNDERYAHLVGKYVKIPLTNINIPIILDEYCDMEKGSGAVKITPAHDFNDFEVGKRHNLKQLNILDEKGHLNNNVPIPYQGMFYIDARETILRDLETLDLIAKIEDIKHSVPYGDRSHVEVQPMLTDQWFIDAKKMVGPALEAVRSGETSFIPKQWENTYFEWLNNIQPWCISRQLWWGHQIPAWYGEDGHIFVAANENEALIEARQYYKKNDVILKQDEDVLDTWFSSALWPFSTLGWPENMDDVERYYPTSVLVTGFDIIFFWVARMMMMGLHFIKKVPFKDVYIHALVRDEHGQKMSKSKGNVIDPLILVDKFGADALRFTLCSLSTPGRDIKMGEARVESNRNFMTKLWNSARFLEMNNCEYDAYFDPSKVGHALNCWLVQEISIIVQEATTQLEAYRFDLYANYIYQWFWNTYCGVFLEALKPMLSDNIPLVIQAECRKTATWGFLSILKILHPVTPIITEALWEYFSKSDDMLITTKWPCEHYTFAGDHHIIQNVFNFAAEVRSLKGLLGVQPGAKIDISLKDSPNAEQLCHYTNLIQHLARVNTINISDKNDGVPFIVGDISAMAYLGDDVDMNDVLSLLVKKRDKLKDDLMRLEKKLGNPSYQNAKPDLWKIDHDMQQEKAIECQKIEAILNVL
jgi:valyl-tRNA synthetase